MSILVKMTCSSYPQTPAWILERICWVNQTCFRRACRVKCHFYKMKQPVNTEEYCLNDEMISRQFKILATPLEEARGWTGVEQVDDTACVGNILLLLVGAGFTMCMSLLRCITHTHVPSILLCVEYCEIKNRSTLEKEMATHSSILAWRIPWTEELLGYILWGCTEHAHTWTYRGVKSKRG